MNDIMRRWWPAAIAFVTWAGLTAATFTQVLPLEAHGLSDIAVGCLTFWAIVRHDPRPRIRPGERIVTDEEAERMEDAAFRAALISLGQTAPQRPSLRAVSGED